MLRHIRQIRRILSAGDLSLPFLRHPVSRRKKASPERQRLFLTRGEEGFYYLTQRSAL